VCVATDVAARGLDLPDLDLVIHADPPRDRETLLHRSGRTGRAGRKGVSVLLVPYTRQRKAAQLLGSAQVEAVWSGPPLAEEIRERDQQRLLEGPLLQEAASDEDLALGRKLLLESPPEVVAAALVRLYRSRLPDPEDVFDDGRNNEPPPREPQGRGRELGRREREPQAGLEQGVWFRMPVGRQDRADPKWLIPLICRRGHVTKKDIGQIRIAARETLFEIAPALEARFNEALRNVPAGDVPIERAGSSRAAAPSRPPSRGGRPPPGKPPRKRGK
jgi:ATP-dependent RNA helicase DeaD